MRLAARVISLLLLAVAVIAGVVDVIQSVAAGTILLQPLGEAWAATSPETLALAENAVRTHIPGDIAETVLAFVIAQPAVLIFLVLAFLFYAAGYQRRKPAGRFAA